MKEFKLLPEGVDYEKVELRFLGDFHYKDFYGIPKNKKMICNMHNKSKVGIYKYWESFNRGVFGCPICELYYGGLVIDEIREAQMDIITM